MRLDIWSFVRWPIDFKILEGKFVRVDPRAATLLIGWRGICKSSSHVSDDAKRCVSGWLRDWLKPFIPKGYVAKERQKETTEESRRQVATTLEILHRAVRGMSPPYRKVERKRKRSCKSNPPLYPQPPTIILAARVPSSFVPSTIILPIPDSSRNFTNHRITWDWPAIPALLPFPRLHSHHLQFVVSTVE